MNKAYVHEYVKLETTNWWFLIRKKIIIQTIQKFITGRQSRRLHILNVGIASGASSKWLTQFGDVVSVENDPDFLKYLHSQNIPVSPASITALPFDNEYFDLVCAFDVLEHVTEDHVAADELFRVCRPGGNVCITVPAFQSLWGTHDIVNDHKRRYTKKNLQQLLTGHNNVEVTYFSYFNFILFIPIFLFRKVRSLFKGGTKKDRSDFAYFPQHSLINKLLKRIFGVEPFLMKWIKFPFGVSIILMAHKVGPPGIIQEKQKND